jgi:hypothetical protein
MKMYFGNSPSSTGLSQNCAVISGKLLPHPLGKLPDDFGANGLPAPREETSGGDADVAFFEPRGLARNQMNIAGGCCVRSAALLAHQGILEDHVFTPNESYGPKPLIQILSVSPTPNSGLVSDGNSSRGDSSSSTKHKVTYGWTSGTGTANGDGWYRMDGDKRVPIPLSRCIGKTKINFRKDTQSRPHNSTD